MKIIVDDPHIGRFEWEMPVIMQKRHEELGKILRGKMGLSEELASAARELQH
jgi:hypothetical protein